MIFTLLPRIITLSENFWLLNRKAFLFNNALVHTGISWVQLIKNIGQIIHRLVLVYEMSVILEGLFSASV